LHEEGDRVAVRAAAEAVVELLGRAHRERRRLLAVERAAGGEVGAGLLERDVTLDHVDDVDAVEQFLLERVRNHGPATYIGEIAVEAKPVRDSQPASFALTRAETFAMSARPASLPLSTPITLPMSAAPFAP